MQTRPESPLSGLRVLVVDDEPTFLRAVGEVLASEGLQVTSAGSAEEALALLERQAYDLAFIDLRLPGMSGVELLSRIRETWPELEVVVVSAYASLESAVHAIRKDVFDFLLKPIEDLDTLVAVVRRVAEKRRMEEDKRRLIDALQRRNREFQLLVDWGHSLADSLVIDEVAATAVAGLSALGGDAPAALYLGSGAAQLECLAVFPASAGAALPGPVPAPRPSASAATLAGSPEVRRAIGATVGPVRQLFPLPLGGVQSGLLVLGPPRRADPSVSEETLNQFAGQVTTALARALSYARISERTYRDSLTGLYNRRYLHERMIDEVARARRYTRPLGLLFLDVDGFKQINDRFGHLAGDRVLVTIGQIIRFAGQPAPGRNNRASDVPIRYGGDEFVLLLPETNRAGAEIKAERVRRAVEVAERDPEGQALPGPITISVGVAEFPGDAHDDEGVLAAADRALYRAKAAGRNRVATPQESER